MCQFSFGQICLPIRLFTFAVLVSWLGPPAVSAAAPTVSKVRAAQRAGTQLVDITYDVADADSSSLTVSVALSTNGGASYFTPGASLSGALGAGIAPGSNKKITWNAGVDLPAKLFSNVRVHVTASSGISDNFDDGVIDASKWTTSGYSVQETSGYMRVGQDATDNGGNLLSIPVPISTSGVITISRRVFVHKANSYFAANMSFRFGGLPWAAVHYADHSYTGGGAHDRHGTFISRTAGTPDGAWVNLVYESNPTNIVGPFPMIWDTWFAETVKFSPDTGILQYFVNDVKLCDYFIGVMPVTNNPTIQFGFASWGWFTGHYQLIDDFVVSQNGISTPVDLGFSSIFTVDFQANALAASGRVLNATNRAPISGAAVTLAGQSTSSSGAGLFSFASVSLSSGNTLAVSKSGFATYTGTVPAPAGATAVTVPDILLSDSTGGSKPVVTGLQAQREGLFLGGIALLNDFTATVDWQGRTPAKVYFYVNGTLAATKPTSGTEATATLDMSWRFSANFSYGANKLKVVAEDAIGVTSAPYEITVRVIPLPAFLTGAPASVVGAKEATYSFNVTYPSDKYPVKALQTIPFLGDFGWDLQFIGGYEYALDSGEWTLYAGTQPTKSKDRVGERPHSSLTKPKFYVGNRDIEFGVKLQAEGTATQTGGIVVNEAGVVVSVDVKQEMLAFYLTDYVPGIQWVRILDRLKWLGVDVNSVQRVRVYGLLEGEFQLMLQFQPTPAHFNGAGINLELGLEAAYEPDLKVAKMRTYVGGKVKGDFEIPYVPLGFKMKRITGEVYGGVSIESWIFDMNEEFIIVQGTLWENLAARSDFGAVLASSDSQTTTIILPAGHRDFGPRQRDYLEAGPERFVAVQSKLARSKSGRPSTLADFRQMGSAPAHQPKGQNADGSAAAKAGPMPLDGPMVMLDQADLALVENVFPGSSPAMASKGQELMLLYVADNGASNALRCTDIRWTRFDGTNWSTPTAIQTNTQAEFAPQVAYDGNGDAIAVWERVADPNFNQTNLTAMAAQMEVVWSKWNHTSGQWSVPQPLTANGYLNHAPLLCGPMNNGTALATWTANTSNLLMGTNGAGSQVWWAQWNPASQSWSPPQTLLADLPNRLSQSLSGVSNRAVYAWTRDLDGVLTNANDQQVFFCAWSNGVWGATKQFTTNTVGNRNARVSVGPDGHNYLVWQSGTNLVLSRDFSTDFTLVRADSQTAGFADYAMTIGPAGNLALLWQEMSQAGSDAHYRVLDPASATWSKDAQLFNDPPLERSFAPVWDDVGNLTVAYNKVEIIYTNKTVTLEGGGTVTITNVPQPGRVDLCVTKRRLIKDVTLAAGDFIVESENYLPGAAVTLSATLRNSGDLAVSNAVVAFYDGNPTNGGVIITNVAISGWLEGAATTTVSALWVVPEPATNHVLYAVADPAGALTEFDESNNMQSLSIGGTDLAVSLVSQSAETNGAVRVIAQVQNLGAPSAANSVLAIRRAGGTNTPLATVSVPLLEPGRLAQVALDLPARTQSEGEQVYTLRADETRVTSDVDTNNNTASFAVNLWIDSDGDGMPDGWMMSFFGHANGLAGDHSRAQDDFDGDGLSNLAEYQAGTNPTNSTSYLKIMSLSLGGTNGVQVAWGSTSNRLYSVLRSSVLSTNGTAFTNLAEHILSTPPENVFFDTTATNASPLFYRIKVE